MPILDGHKVDASQITSEKHRFIGMWRPPVPPKREALADGAGYTCPGCGGGILQNQTNQHLGQIRQCWQQGCFDEAQYVTIPINSAQGD